MIALGDYLLKCASLIKSRFGRLIFPLVSFYLVLLIPNYAFFGVNFMKIRTFKNNNKETKKAYQKRP